MSMRHIEYQGYGVDIADLVPYLVQAGGADTADRLSELVSEAWEVVDGEVMGISVYTPTNTDKFGCLFVIDAIIPVSNGTSDVKIYTIPEANNTLQLAIARFVSLGVETSYLTQEDYELITTVVANNISSLAGYSWDHDWSDLV